MQASMETEPSHAPWSRNDPDTPPSRPKNGISKRRSDGLHASSAAARSPSSRRQQHPANPATRNAPHFQLLAENEVPDGKVENDPPLIPVRPVFKMKRTGFSGPFPSSGPQMSASTSWSSNNAKKRPRLSKEGTTPTTSAHETEIPPKSFDVATGTAAKLQALGVFSPLIPTSSVAIESRNRDMENVQGLDQGEISLSSRASSSLRPSNRSMASVFRQHQRRHPSKLQGEAAAASFSPASAAAPAFATSSPDQSPVQSPEMTQDDHHRDGGGLDAELLIASDVPTSAITRAHSAHLVKDDSSYRTWVDESGTLVTTAGALLPPGYKTLDDPDYPWICPVRSCRKRLQTLFGLGKHFGVSHRSSSFNDNTDGTLSDLGTYPGGGLRGCKVSSRKPMSLVESPMAKSSLHYNAKKASRPSRGGPKSRRLRVEVAPLKPMDDEPTTSDDDDDALNGGPRRTRMPVNIAPAQRTDFDHLDLQDDAASISESSADIGMSYKMANSDRPYNMWPDDTGVLRSTPGILIPDGYELDNTMPDRPWICPVRNCRRLYAGRGFLGYHFRTSHLAAQLNDNLDGTFTAMNVSVDKNSPATVVSRNILHDQEPMRSPQKPWYYTGGKSVTWISAVAGDDDQELDDFQSTAKVEIPRETRTRQSRVVTIEKSPPPSSATPENQVDLAPKGRQYSEWWDEDGNLMRMNGALIPEGFRLDYSPLTPWICPIRTCRLLSKTRKGLGYHFIIKHNSEQLNDNWDGTFSVVGSHHGKGAQVVSQKPLDPKEPPMIAPQLPNSQWGHQMMKQGGDVAVTVTRAETSGEEDEAMEEEMNDTNLPGRRRRSHRLTAANGSEQAAAHYDAPARQQHSKRLVEAASADYDQSRERSTALAPSIAVPARTDIHSVRDRHGRFAPERDQMRPRVLEPQYLIADRPDQLHVYHDDAIQMEDWERNQGRILGAGDPGGIGVSSAYLSSNMSVQLGIGFTILAIKIASGETHVFHSDPTKTRVCYLGSGKVRVQVDGEPEFTIGVQGIWKIRPGVRCEVKNWAYVDAMLHVTVTTLAD
ncbi:hypothetical protein B0T22DRAFT_449282 [Podospora appendiculata]|uniref:C2H2-type domain-containing protein n=1 Tax=Podospora appendiculata TaxID=314037 RepID=A0AAE1CGE2_9PEZI|nr:hypothetical protein B0T22DRAFT_449282 [Podospora appendiculata]